MVMFHSYVTLPEGILLGSFLARPVHPISTDSGELWGRSSGEVHFICQEIEVEKCYGDLQKLPEKSIVVDGGLNLGICSFWALRSDQGCADSLKCLLHKRHATFPMTKRMLDEGTTISPVVKTDKIFQNTISQTLV